MNIALIAHENKKILLENLCVNYRQTLMKHNLIASEAMGHMIEGAAHLNVGKYFEEALGGKEQLAFAIASNDIDLVIYLQDPYKEKSNEPDIRNTLNLCNIYNIPLASNIATAQILLNSLDTNSF